MRRDADARIRGQGGQRRLGPLQQALEVLGRGAETVLARRQRAAVHAAELVMHGQKRQPDAGAGAGGGDARRHLGDIVVMAAAGAVMQIVKLDIGGVTGLEHLHLHEAGDGLNVVGRQVVQKAVHDLAPCPEGVARLGALGLAEAGHGALECVAVQVRHRGQQQADALACRGGARLDPGDPALIQRHADMFCPAIGQQGPFRPDMHHRLAPLHVK